MSGAANLSVSGRAKPDMADGSQQTASTELMVLSVLVRGQPFAIDIEAVRELRAWSAPVVLPGAPAFVQGMCDLRGTVVPLIDLAARLGLRGEASDAPVTVMVEIRGVMAGLVVDAVCDLLRIDASRLQPTPETGSSDPGGLLAGVVEIDGRILGLIAIDGIVPRALDQGLAEPAAFARLCQNS